MGWWTKNRRNIPDLENLDSHDVVIDRKRRQILQDEKKYAPKRTIFRVSHSFDPGKILSRSVLGGVHINGEKLSGYATFSIEEDGVGPWIHADLYFTKDGNLWFFSEKGIKYVSPTVVRGVHVSNLTEMGYRREIPPRQFSAHKTLLDIVHIFDPNDVFALDRFDQIKSRPENNDVVGYVIIEISEDGNPVKLRCELRVTNRGELIVFSPRSPVIVPENLNIFN